MAKSTLEGAAINTRKAPIKQLKNAPTNGIKANTVVSTPVSPA